MMDHETPPRISLLDRLVKAIRPSPAPAMSSPEMAEPAMHQPAMGEEPSGTMAEPAMHQPAMGDHGDPAAVDEPSMG